MLDDNRRRFGELQRQVQGRVHIGDVVVAQRLPLDLLGAGDSRFGAPAAVERRPLMRVLAIAKRLSGAARDREARRRGHVEPLGEPCRNRGVVGGGAGERRLRQAAAQRAVERAAGRVERCDNCVVIGGIGDCRDESMILRRRPQHRRPADVDILHTGGGVAALGDGAFERIEVDRHEVDRADAVSGHGRAMAGIVAPREKSAVDYRVQGLDPAVEHFGEAGKVFDPDDGESGLFERARGAARGENFDAVARESGGEGDDSGLVRHRKQSARHPDRRIFGPWVATGGHRIVLSCSRRAEDSMPLSVKWPSNKIRSEFLLYINR